MSPEEGRPPSLAFDEDEHHHDHEYGADEYHPPPARVRALPFAGRIGGNLAFSRHDVKKTPDAAQLTSIRQVGDLHGFLEPIYMRAAVIECVGTGLLVFTAGLVDNAFGSYAKGTNQLAWNLGHTVTTWMLITLFLYAAAPASGGHLNPFITMSTFFAGLCTLPRGVYYIIGQLIGALAGGWFLKLGLGGSTYFYPEGIVGGCTFDFRLISTGQAYVLELGCYMASVFLAFGVGLDPRQGQVFGPALSPILVGAVVALCSFGTGEVRPGWSGASLNPARCFGLMAAKQGLSSHWIHWLAAITAGALNGLLYNLIPPNPKSKTK